MTHNFPECWGLSVQVGKGLVKLGRDMAWGRPSDKTEGQVGCQGSDGSFSFSRSAGTTWGMHRAAVWLKWEVSQGLRFTVPRSRYKTAAKSYWCKLGQSNHPHHGKYQTDQPTKAGHCKQNTCKSRYYQRPVFIVYQENNHSRPGRGNHWSYWFLEASLPHKTFNLMITSSSSWGQQNNLSTQTCVPHRREVLLENPEAVNARVLGVNFLWSIQVRPPHRLGQRNNNKNKKGRLHLWKTPLERDNCHSGSMILVWEKCEWALYSMAWTCGLIWGRIKAAHFLSLGHETAAGGGWGGTQAKGPRSHFVK